MYKKRHWLLLIAIVLLANGFVSKDSVNFRGEADEPYRTKLIKKVDALSPEIVLVGNSILGRGIDEKQFSELVHLKALNLPREGTGSTVWFLVLKNVIGRALTKPQKVAVLFRETELTDPTFRVVGHYQRQISKLADFDEPLVAKLSYGKDLGVGHELALTYFPLTRIREDVKTQWEGALRYLASRVTAQAKEEIDKQLDQYFAPDRMDQSLFSDLQKTVEDVADVAYDFPRVIDKSYIPAMIQLAKKQGYELYFVRYKKRRHVGREGQIDQGRQAEYFRQLHNYLASNGAYYLDFSGSKPITIEMFADGDHLNETGRQVFTSLLAKEIKDLTGQDPERQS